MGVERVCLFLIQLSGFGVGRDMEPARSRKAPGEVPGDTLPHGRIDDSQGIAQSHDGV